MTQRKNRTVVAILVTGILVACGGSGSDDPVDTGADPVTDTDPVTGTDPLTGTDPVTGTDPLTGTDPVTGTFNQFGVVDVSDSAAGQLIDINAYFFSVTAAFDANLIESAYIGSLDTCDVTEFDFLNLPDVSDILDLTDQVGEMTLLSAGDVITIRSPAGSYTELDKGIFQDFISYQIDGELTGPLPSGLIVDIPGDAFPAFANVQVPDMESISLTSPASGQALTADTVFTWPAGSNANSTVTLSSSQITVGSSTLTSVDCLVTDDGSFTFPEATIAALGGSFSGNSATISRSVSIFQQQGNAVLVVTRDSSGF